MNHLNKKQEERFDKKFPKVSLSRWDGYPDRKVIKQHLANELSLTRKEVIEEIITWSRGHHTGNIDELYEVNLSDLLRHLTNLCKIL